MRESHSKVTVTAFTTTLVVLASLTMGSACPGQLRTRWAEDTTAATEYPRPHLVRQHWQSLNGPWDYAMVKARLEEWHGSTNSPAWQGKILVPFPVESQLSGVGRSLEQGHLLCYRRSFQAAVPNATERLHLNFGAVDWRCAVFVNGEQVGTHQGGYDAFTFDITSALLESGQQELLVVVEDPSSDGYQPRGKQARNPRGIWYTASSGIWQTVWLELVPQRHIREVHCVTDLARRQVTVVLDIAGTAGEVTLTVSAGDSVVRRHRIDWPGGPLRVDMPIAKPRPWSPSDPFLYDLVVRVAGAASEPVDEVRSYFGMRQIKVARDSAGVHRLFLNGAPLFHLGLLDQGFWPDGLYTAPNDTALRFDLEQTKALGFNMVRKHVKIEPERWYYHCDRLGLMVWQDMPSGDRSIGSQAADLTRSKASASNFYNELGALIRGRRQHPCIVAWVPFNEGWGQFETAKVLAWVKHQDPTRLVDGPSGWTDRGGGDMHDIHRYPGPARPKPSPGRAAVLGEFGGLGLPIAGHLWWNKRNWGYRNLTDRAGLQAAYEQLIGRLRQEYARGLAAAVYTQTTDVEGEVNGLMTYDRAVVKLDVARLHQLHQAFYTAPPRLTTTVIVPTSQDQAQRWHFTTSKPGERWWAEDFDTDGWQQGPGGFGRAETPGAVVRTNWTGDELWLRRTFTLKSVADEGLHLRIHHDEDATIYLNGHRIAQLRGYTTDYVDIPNVELSQRLRHGNNLLAVHCKQTGGGQFLDLGIVRIQEAPPK